MRLGPEDTQLFTENQAEPENLLAKLHFQEYFKSDAFSDVVVECEGQTFPAHRVILAGQKFCLRFSIMQCRSCSGYELILVASNRVQPSFQSHA